MDDNPEEMSGVGGTTTFTLVGVSQDKCTFRAVQARSWEFEGFDSDSTRNDWSYIEIPLKVTDYCDSSIMNCIQYGVTIEVDQPDPIYEIDLDNAEHVFNAA